MKTPKKTTKKKKEKKDPLIEQLVLFGAIIGGPHNSAPVHMYPEVRLSQWRVYEVSSKQWKGRTRHFCGYSYEGRASTPIKEFYLDKMMGKTESGRVYELQGSPGFNHDADYIWGVFVDVNGIYDIVDVTNEYYNETTSSSNT